MAELHFLFGVAPRSGTTYLGDLLALHPDCALPVELPEDGVLLSLHHLDAFNDELHEFWGSWPELSLPSRADVLAGIGDGLQNMIVSRATGPDPAIVLSKTPFPNNLSRLGELFPQSKAIVIVRDGRSVVESTVRTWNSPFDVASARFRDGARSILDAIGSTDSVPPHLHLVRYEELFDDPVRIARDALAFLGLDPSLLTSDDVEQSPLRGSSTATTGETEGSVHWEAVERPADFAPTTRWESWTERQHQLFAAVAGPENRALGYDTADVDGSTQAMASTLRARRRVVDALPISWRRTLRRALQRGPR